MRGGTEREFMRYLTRAGYVDATIERPSKLGLRDEFDLWYEISHVNELPRLKMCLRQAFRGLHRVSGVSFTPYLAFAVRKQPASDARRKNMPCCAGTSIVSMWAAPGFTNPEATRHTVALWNTDSRSSSGEALSRALGSISVAPKAITRARSASVQQA